MTISPAERKIRRTLPLIRLMQAYTPLRWSAWLNQRSLHRARMPIGVVRQPVSADGVPCDWLIPNDSPADRAILYLHGGGFVYGQTLLHLEMGAYLAQKSNTRILMVDYRLAPPTLFHSKAERHREFPR
ncbi:MAG: alpha/beta hydrolase [Anaerolineae bacterium]|nr:alpha/beta hydrolase [Anaerolineae bacterium]